MLTYKHLIIGGGMTADAAVQGIREADASGSIGIISAESDPPYDRPPLSKGLWKDQQIDSIWRKHAPGSSQLHLGRKAKEINLWRRQVTDHEGARYAFEKLLLATGGSPRRLPFAQDLIVYFRTLSDYRRVQELARNRDRFLLIGGGFIGCELAASLRSHGKQVQIIFRGKTLGERMFPSDLGRFLNEYYRQRGVELLPQDEVTGVRREAEWLIANTRSGKELQSDAIVAGLGIEPNAELAVQAGLRVDNGVVVDEYLRTSHPSIYAAGDVAAFYSGQLRRRLRVEHEDNANQMGRRAGLNMAGKVQPYTHLPFFYSDLFDLGYEAVGETDARLSTVAEWKEPFREGVVYYHQGGRIRGVLLWNTWGKMDAARALVAGEQRLDERERPAELLAA